MKNTKIIHHLPAQNNLLNPDILYCIPLSKSKPDSSLDLKPKLCTQISPMLNSKIPSSRTYMYTDTHSTKLS